jgi:hypothetical protein
MQKELFPLCILEKFEAKQSRGIIKKGKWYYHVQWRNHSSLMENCSFEDVVDCQKNEAYAALISEWNDVCDKCVGCAERRSEMERRYCKVSGVPLSSTDFGETSDGVEDMTAVTPESDLDEQGWMRGGEEGWDEWPDDDEDEEWNEPVHRKRKVNKSSSGGGERKQKAEAKVKGKAKAKPKGKAKVKPKVKGKGKEKENANRMLPFVGPPRVIHGTPPNVKYAINSTMVSVAANPDGQVQEYNPDAGDSLISPDDSDDSVSDVQWGRHGSDSLGSDSDDDGKGLNHINVSAVRP